jgi:hypothetical protein
VTGFGEHANKCLDSIKSGEILDLLSLTNCRLLLCVLLLRTYISCLFLRSLYNTFFVSILGGGVCVNNRVYVGMRRKLSHFGGGWGVVAVAEG